MWKYRNEQEHQFVWEMELHSIPLSDADSFIEGKHKNRKGELFLLPKAKRDSLLEIRERALQAYKNANQWDSAKENVYSVLAIEAAARLHAECKYLGLYAGTRDAVLAAQKRDRALPGARDTAAKNKKARADEKYAALKRIVEKPASWKYTRDQLVAQEWPAISKLGYSESTAKRYVEEIRAAHRKA